MEQRSRHPPAARRRTYLGLVGLFQLQAVQTHLLIVLAAQLLQCLSHLEVVLLLSAAVHLHQAPLVPPPCLPHLLGTEHGDPVLVTSILDPSASFKQRLQTVPTVNLWGVALVTCSYFTERTQPKCLSAGDRHTQRVPSTHRSVTQP